METEPAIHFGSVIKLQHDKTSKYLRSLSRKLEHPSSSKQQMVVATANGTPETYWRILPGHGETVECGTPVGEKAIVILEHWTTKKNLHSHKDYPAPVTANQQEVTAFKHGDATEENDNWRVELEGEGPWTVNRKIRLVHVPTNAALHTHQSPHPTVSHAVFTAGEQEVTAFAQRNQDDWWAVPEIVVPFPTPEEVTQSLDDARYKAKEFDAFAANMKKLFEETAAHVAQISRDIEDARKHGDTVGGALDAGLARVNEMTNAATDNLKKIEEAFAKAQGATAGAASEAESAARSRVNIEEDGKVTRQLAETAEAVETRLKEAQSRLVALTKQSDELLQRIEGLLAGATNAGLATAWNERSKTFKAPETMWQWVFFGSLGGMFIFASIEAIWGTHHATWQELTRTLLHRLPFIVPLVWLAIYSARQTSLAKRMEEEYAFKATTSMSFEGLRRQIAQIGLEVNAQSPLGRLCENTLQIIAAPPGKVYERHRMDPTPGTAFAETCKPIASALVVLAEKAAESKR